MKAPSGPPTGNWFGSARVLRRARALGLSCVLGLSCLGCESVAVAEDIEASAGVFYGGQVQRLQTVDWSSANPPKLGFRLVFSPAEQRREHVVSWELTRPGPVGRRVTELGTEKLAPGRQQFDQVLDIPPSAPLGPINVRVLVGDQLVIDRALLLRSRP